MHIRLGVEVMAPGSTGQVRGRVLVIDDQPINIRLVKLLLENSGFTVIPAMSGAEGVALAAEMSPDVVLLDMRMPGMDGFQVLERFRADPRLLAHEGRAIVFEDIHDLAARVDDPDLDMDADSVMLLRNAGPVGAPGMPE